MSIAPLLVRSPAIELPSEILVELEDRFGSRRPSSEVDPVDILSILARSHRPATRRAIADELDVSLTNLAKTMTVLHEEGYICSSRRFGVTLGIRFLDHPDLFRLFRETTIALAIPHLEQLAYRHDATAAIAFAAGPKVIVAETRGPASRHEVEQNCQAAMAYAVGRWTESPPLDLLGIIADRVSDTEIALAARVRLAGSSGVVACRVKTPSGKQFAEIAASVSQAAGELSSALRRVFPLASAQPR